MLRELLLLRTAGAEAIPGMLDAAQSRHSVLPAAAQHGDHCTVRWLQVRPHAYTQLSCPYRFLFLFSVLSIDSRPALLYASCLQSLGQVASNQVRVWNIPAAVPEERLRALFEGYGKLSVECC